MVPTSEKWKKNNLVFTISLSSIKVPWGRPDPIKFHGKALYSPIALHMVKGAPAYLSPTQKAQLQHNHEERGLGPVKLHGGLKRLAVP